MRFNFIENSTDTSVNNIYFSIRISQFEENLHLAD